MRVALPQVTLVGVDTRHPQLLVAAMQRTMAQVAVGAARLFTDRAQRVRLPLGVVRRDVVVGRVADDSRVLLREVAPHVATSHALVVQWDGFALDARQWDDAFLEWDYVGAPWPERPDERAVGHGGFSLRSKRLLEAVAALAPSCAHRNDMVLAHDLRGPLEAQGLRFAPRAVGRRFAIGRGDPRPSFGFHGLAPLADLWDDDALRTFLATLPDEAAASLEAHDLASTLIARGQLQCAARLVGMRRRLGMRDRHTLRLWWRLQAARFKARLRLRGGTSVN